MINYIILLGHLPFTLSQITTQELENESAQEIANRTYVEEQTELQRTILSKYNKRIRPVLNTSEPLDVAVHVYIMHISVNQMEQTITVNGHIYMTWKDEYAVWEPSEHNGVRITMVKQWEVWTPELRITNSVSGVGQFFEISKRSHVIIHSNGKAWSRIEIYPTFSIKIGCAFDYSAYPFDSQKCGLGLYTSSRMSEVQLSVYYNMQPTVLLGSTFYGNSFIEGIAHRYGHKTKKTRRSFGMTQRFERRNEALHFKYRDFSSDSGWGAQSGKKHVSDWMVDSVTMNVSYFSGGKYKDERPVDADELDVSWSILYTWLTLHRNAFCFSLAVLLPTLISYMLVIYSFLLPSPDSSVYILLANLFFLGTFLEDLTAIIPPAIGRLPKIVWFTSINFVLTLVAVFVQLWFRYLLKRDDAVTRWYSYLLHAKRVIPERWRTGIFSEVTGDRDAEQGVITGKGVTWTTIVNYARLLLLITYFCVFFIALIVILT